MPSYHCLRWTTGPTSETDKHGKMTLAPVLEVAAPQLHSLVASVAAPRVHSLDAPVQEPFRMETAEATQVPLGPARACTGTCGCTCGLFIGGM